MASPSDPRRSPKFSGLGERSRRLPPVTRTPRRCHDNLALQCRLPSYVSIWVEAIIGRNYEAIMNFEKARKFYESAIRLEPGFLGAALALADLPVTKGRNKDSVLLLERYLRQWADDSLHQVGSSICRDKYAF